MHFQLIIEFLEAMCCFSGLQVASLQARGAPGEEISEAQGASANSKVLERLGVLQAYLGSYATRNVPVVPVYVSGFQETLDQLHDYLLQCIEMSMEPPDD